MLPVYSAILYIRRPKVLCTFSPSDTQRETRQRGLYSVLYDYDSLILYTRTSLSPSLMPESVVDEAIRVTVTPTQASYFAGEPFIVNITFTNIRSPETAPTTSTLRSASHGHKRSAHSISYVPLSRPPTSPGMSRSAHAPVMPVRGATKKAGLSRKGLIGRRLSSEDRMKSPSASFEGRQGLLASKSLSISISPHELQLDVHADSKGKSPLQNGELRSNAECGSVTKFGRGSTSPHIFPPLARSSILPLGPNHPHARKSSLMDGQLQLHDIRATPSTSPFATTTPSASTSSFSLSLDPISENSPVSIPSATPLSPSPIPEESNSPFIRSPTLASVTTSTNGAKAHAYPSIPSQTPRHFSHIGNGHPPTTDRVPRTAPAHSTKFVLPSTELILYSYAQLRGTLSITTQDTDATPEQLDTLNHVRSKLLKRQVVGGGSMDITASLNLMDTQPSQHTPGRRHQHHRSASIFTVLSPSASAPAWTPTHRQKAPSIFSLFASSSQSGDDAEPRSAVDEEIDPELPLPTLEMQPSMLAVDLSLAPGESRSCACVCGSVCLCTRNLFRQPWLSCRHI